LRLTRLSLFLALVCLLAARAADAGTLRVCATGCAYSALQAAIDAAVPGDTIMLRAGETFVGPFVLRAKPASTAWITIRSDAADASLPAAGVRLVPSGRPSANTDRSLLPRLLGQGGALKTTPVLRTEAGAHHYRLQFLEIDGSANLGFETLINLGDDTAATPPHDLVIDRVYAHGHPYRGQKRGISLNGASTQVLNSYICDIKAVNADSQAIAGYNGPGPFRIVNNYLEGAGENIIFGGSDPAVSNLVPTAIEVRGNHLFKPLAWRNAILSPPASLSAGASAVAGGLAAGTHYFKVVAVMRTDTVTAVSKASVEVSASLASGSRSASLTWSAVPGADFYRIYRGLTSNGESRYMQTASSATSFTYTGTSESSGTPPAAGTTWTVKNIFELKNAQQVTVEGNIFENIWQAGQYGYALVLTPRNQGGTAPWVRVRDVTFVNNIVRHASGVLQLSGYDANDPSQQTQRITLRNNLFYDIDPQKWGGGAKAYLIGEGPADIVLDHNTLIHTNSSVVYAYGTQTIAGFVYTNNISRHNAYGIMSEGGRPGQYTLNKYFPGANVTYNVLAGGPASSYPSPNSFPTLAEWNASFVDASASDYRLLTSSVFYAGGSGGGVPGADIGAIDAAVSGSPLPAPVSGPPAPNTPPVARPGGPYSGASGVPLTVDGSASSDAEGGIVAYTWTWSDDVLIRAADVAAADIVGGRWTRTQTSTAAGGVALHNPDLGQAKLTAALASPASYVDVRFYAAAGVPYRLWFRMRADGDSYANDSMFVQFSGAVDAQGQRVQAIGTSDAAVVILEEGKDAGVSGWGWNDASYGSLAAPVYFAQPGLQTIRIQQREDGIMWDQIVISSAVYFNGRPGLTRDDATVVPVTFGTGDSVVTTHTYRQAGQYPIVLRVTDTAGASSAAATSAAIGSGNAGVVARAGGPYSGSVGQPVAFDGSASSAPSSAAYRWTFGDDIVLDASVLRASGGRWLPVADPTAARGAALENPDAGDPKVTTAAANPASYVEATFRAAAGVPYRLWLRMRAAADSYSNDSVYVQFSGTVNASGTPVTRIGSSSGLSVVLEDGSGAGVQGWGWADASYGALASPIYFNADGVQTIRIQQREDGVRIDQVVISAGQYATAAPGSPRQDGTIVPAVGATDVKPSHAYRLAGVYPLTLTVDAGTSGTSIDTTTAAIK
jgi:hypothetical protein